MKWGLNAQTDFFLTDYFLIANYPDNVNCYWYLKFTPGSQIEIRASSFSLDSDCAADNVTIRNGGGVDSPVLWSGCGATLPPTLMSQSNVISIQVFVILVLWHELVTLEKLMGHKLFLKIFFFDCSCLVCVRRQKQCGWFQYFSIGTYCRVQISYHLNKSFKWKLI